MVISLFGTRYKASYDRELEERLNSMLFNALREAEGFVSFHTYTADDGELLGVIRFETREALEAWRDDPTHRSVWPYAPDFYDHFWIQNAETYREYGWRPGGRTGEDMAEKFRHEAANLVKPLTATEEGAASA